MKVCNKSRERETTFEQLGINIIITRKKRIQILENENSKNRKTQIDHERKSNYRDRIDRPSVRGSLTKRWSGYS